MKGPSKISLAIALALMGGNAFALGLGSIQVKSGLNQPLDAEIAVTTDSPAEAAGLNVSLASAEDFERVGLSRARVTVPIDFSVSTNSRGQPVIKLTSKDIVREPFLDFLVEVNWPKGKLLREYTVLLDPPVTAPAARGAPASVAPAKESVAAAPQKLTEEPKQPKGKATTVKPPKSAGTEPKQPPASKASAPSTAKAPSGGDYGPVAEGETLSEVARATRPDDATNLNQMMLALLKANPNAFYKDNINALKRGAILRIPSGEDIKATGNAAAVAAAVRDQNESWSGNAAAAKPTVVANAGAPATATKPAPSTTSKPAKAAPGEHLALVPPRAGKDSQVTADRPGPAAGNGGGNAETKAELARTKEALASREQESTELKSRVKQLEDINNKDQRLLSLKENEIAELQSKLKELQAKAGAPVTTAKPPETSTASTAKPATPTPAPSATPSATPSTAAKPGETKLTAEDIWGNIANSEKAGPKPTTPSTATTPSATPAPSATPGTTAATPAPTPAPSTTPSAAPSTASTTPAPTPTPSSTTTPTGTTVTPVTTPSTTAPTAIAPPTPKPTPKPTPTPAPPPPAPEAWYQNTSNLALIGGGLLLLVVGAFALLRFMRKPKAVLAPSGMGAIDEPMPLTGEEEHHLLDALAQNPGDPHLSLELLRLYYAERDAAKFEAAAEAMYAHIADPSQPEWQEVRAMGSDLCPHNPLFSGEEAFGGGEHAAHDTVFGHYDAGQAGHEESFDLGAHETHAAPAEENFDFDLTDHSAATTTAPVEDLSFDAEPLDMHVPAPAPAPAPAPKPAPAPAPAAATVRAPIAAPAPAPAPAAKPADDFFAGEDAIGTKLDLAKAYLDMGDPEGARSMLDEVMAEGNDSQKGEARKLLAEIR